jgi:hypothetical protein
MKNSNKTILIIVICIVATGLFGIFFTILQQQNVFAPEIDKNLSLNNTIKSSSVISSSLQSSIISNPNTVSTSNNLSDKLYTSTINYKVPEGGANIITVNATVDTANTIKSISNEYVGAARESIRYKNSFQSLINQETVGKKITEIDLKELGGASLTTRAFMDAIKEINASIK